jgi:hypothetical protein
VNHFFCRSLLESGDGAGEGFARFVGVLAVDGLKDLFGMGFQGRFYGNVALPSSFALVGPFQG